MATVFRDMNNEIQMKRKAYSNAENDYDMKERHYRSNSQLWKEQKAYDEIRTARWNKDEARKEQTRRKKDLDATLMKAGPMFRAVNISSSEGNSKCSSSRIVFFF